jgi:hypothetical protein
MVMKLTFCDTRALLDCDEVVFFCDVVFLCGGRVVFGGGGGGAVFGCCAVELSLVVEAAEQSLVVVAVELSLVVAATEVDALVVAAKKVDALVVAANDAAVVSVMSPNWKFQSLPRQTQYPS